MRPDSKGPFDYVQERLQQSASNETVYVGEMTMFPGQRWMF